MCQFYPANIYYKKTVSGELLIYWAMTTNQISLWLVGVSCTEDNTWREKKKKKLYKSFGSETKHT